MTLLEDVSTNQDDKAVRSAGGKFIVFGSGGSRQLRDGWSVEQAKEFFMEEGFQDEGNSLQQAARGTYDPAYLNYNMAKLLIMRLRDDWTASRGGREAWKAFHDEFLSYGGPPIPLVRMAMMGEPEPRALFPAFLDPWKEGGATTAAVRQDTFAFACEDGRRVVLNRKEGQWWLFLPERTVPLAPVEAASGAKYQGEGCCPDENTVNVSGGVKTGLGHFLQDVPAELFVDGGQDDSPQRTNTASFGGCCDAGKNRPQNSQYQASRR